MENDVINPAKTYYALQRKSDGAWIGMANYPTAKINKEPTPLRKLSTAREQRLIAMLDGHMDIEIRKLEILVEPKEIVVDDAVLTDRVSQLAVALSKKTSPPYNFHSMKTWIINAEKLLEKNTDLRYCMIIRNESFINGVKNDHFARKILKDMVDFVNMDFVWLVRSDSDLVTIKLYGVVPIFIYDFEERKIIFQS